MITEEIIKKAQEGDNEAFAIIYNETVKTAYYVAKRILISEDATEDEKKKAEERENDRERKDRAENSSHSSYLLVCLITSRQR